MLTAFSQREFVEKARDAGAMAYLVKPFTKPTWCRRSRWRSVATPSSPRSRREVADLTERLETRKLVERAKGFDADSMHLPNLRPSSGSSARQWIEGPP